MLSLQQLLSSRQRHRPPLGWMVQTLRWSRSLCSQRKVHHSAWRDRWDKWSWPVQMVTEWCPVAALSTSSVPTWPAERLIPHILLCKLLCHDLFAHPSCSTPVVVSYNILMMYLTGSLSSYKMQNSTASLSSRTAWGWTYNQILMQYTT